MHLCPAAVLSLSDALSRSPLRNYGVEQLFCACLQTLGDVIAQLGAHGAFDVPGNVARQSLGPAHDAIELS